MTDDTNIGGRGSGFPATRWSAVLAACSSNTVERARGLEAIAAAYWKPVYKYIRIRWGKSNEDAKDLTQEFFARLLEKDYLEKYDPARARLRTYLRTCVDGVVANEERSMRRIKRGGQAVLLSFDFNAAENEFAALAPPGTESPEEFFEKEWVRSVFALAVERLRRECDQRNRAQHFRLFELYDLESGKERRTYEELAREFRLSVTDATNYLSLMRREFRCILLDLVREMTASEEEFRREARALFGVDPE